MMSLRKCDIPPAPPPFFDFIDCFAVRVAVDEAFPSEFVSVLVTRSENDWNAAAGDHEDFISSFAILGTHSEKGNFHCR